MDTRKRLPLRLPRIATGKPLRFLGRRLIQEMAENAVSNFLLGERSVPSKFVVLRLVTSDDERDAIELEFAESRAAIEREVGREASARHYRLRSDLDLELRVLTETELTEDAGLGQLAAAQGEDRAALVERLREEDEILLCRRTHSVVIESEPAGAAVYLDGRQMERVTPCTVNELPAGEYALRLALPGHVLHESRLVVQESGGRRQRRRVSLKPEPPMSLVEVVTFPARASLRVEGEARETPTTLRLPAGRHRFEADLDDFEPAVVEVDVEPLRSVQPRRVELKLAYAGADRDEVVGKLIVYRPGVSAVPSNAPSPANPVAAFFRDPVDSAVAQEPAPSVAAERPLTRGVLVFGREDPASTVYPDVRLKDAGNTVSRGCHAWLHVYSDPGTGAEYNTFVIHNNSPKGVRVDGKLVTESVALGDDALVEIGIFRLRILKQTPEPVVEL